MKGAPKKILIVGLSANEFMRGVERVVFEILKKLATINVDDEELEVSLLLGRWQNYYLELERYGVRLIYADCDRKLFSRHWYCWYHLAKVASEYDLCHLFNTLPVRRFNSTPTIVTIHDVAEFAMPEKYSWYQAVYRRFVAKVAVAVSEEIVTVSRFSVGEIKKFLKVKRVCLIENGVDHLEAVGDNSSPDAVQPRSELVTSINGRYLLYYGVLEKTKGLDIAINGFKRINKGLYGDVKLLIIGKTGNLYSKIKKELGRDGIIWVDHVSDQELRYAIRGSQATLFLSEYEGFGFPAAEAIMAGAQVVVGKDTVVSEICRPFCREVDLYDIRSVVEGLENSIRHPFVIGQEARRCEMLSRFSWNSSAMKLRKLYFEVLGRIERSENVRVRK